MNRYGKNFLAGAIIATALIDLRGHLAKLATLAVLVIAWQLGADMSTVALGGVILATQPFPVNPIMTAIAIMYKNPDVNLIAEAVLPSVPTARKFKYLVYDLAQGFTVPDTRVGRKSEPNQAEFTATENTGEVIDYGLDDLVPVEDQEDDNQGVDPLNTAAGYLTNLINLGREIRVSNLVFNSASYAAGLSATLSGTSQWSDQVNSDPVSAIGDALDTPIMRPNIAVFGQVSWTKTRRHPKLVQAIKGTAQGAGMVSRQEFADFFELQDVQVGAGFVNTAKRGQAVSMSRVWGKHAAFIYRDRSAGPQAGVTFGFTASRGDKTAGTIDEPKKGLRGSTLVRVGERKLEVISAPDVGYFFQNAVA